MFKKLRNRLIIVNLSILTVLLVAIFGSLYISTYQDVNARNEYELNRLLIPHLPGFPGGSSDGEPIQSLSFLVEVQDDDVIDTFSHIQFDEEFYQGIYDLVDGDEGVVEFATQTWQYKVAEHNDTTVIAFLNITNDLELLSDTLTTYIIIFIISFILVALISYFMTNRSIKPIKVSYDKQKRFISDASHELKTPLTVINANVDVLLSQNTNKKDKKWLEYIQKEVVRMNKLTHNLLYLATISNEEKKFIKTQVDISSEVESLLLGVEALAYEKEISLQYDIAPNLDILFNQEQLTQSLMILLDNAIKYTPNNGNIDVNLRSSNNHVYFTIRNTGAGIKESEIPRLFDRFYKVDESRATQSDSYGLGLSILKAICDYHSTKIHIKSEEGSFTEFELKFPIK